MNRPVTLSVPTAHERNAALCIRARKIAERLSPFPTGEAINGFYHRQAFIDRCNARARHEQTYRRVFARLAAKEAPILNLDVKLDEGGASVWL